MQATRSRVTAYHYREKVANVAGFDTCPSDHRKAHNVLLLGDSHANSLRPLVQAMKNEGSFGTRGTVSAITAGCPIDEHMNVVGHYCAGNSMLAFARAMQPDVDAVLFAFSPWWTSADGKVCATKGADICGQALTAREAETIFLTDLKTKVHEMKGAGKIVILQLPIPTYNKSVPLYQLTKVTYGPARQLFDTFSIALPRPLERHDYLEMRRGVEAIAKAEGAILFDPRPALCNGETCVYQEGSVSLYMDSNHLANSKIGLLRKPLEEAFATAFPAPSDMLAGR